MARFTDCMIAERVRPFWAAMQGGEFITDAAAEAGTYRKKGTRWVAAAGGVRPRRGRGLQGRYLSFSDLGGDDCSQREATLSARSRRVQFAR
jgi:transposase, IS30 family